MYLIGLENDLANFNQNDLANFTGNYSHKITTLN